MLSKGFKICDKKRFDLYIEEVKCEKNEAIIKVEKACICKADLRYYLGTRNKRILDLKYPMNLIHEAIGVVTKDPTRTFTIGDKVALVPNIACKECSKCKLKCHGENYCPHVKFASSNYDGFSREYLSFPVRNLIPINGIETDVAVFLELMSVANAAIERINIEVCDRIAIFGDGIVGYILCCMLRSKFNGTIIAVGKHKEKLEKFPAHEKILLEELRENITFSIAFECVGGKGMEDALEKILQFIDIGGNVVLTGVAENNISINTRRILEKKITICGSTRSTVSDFKTAMNLLVKDKNLYNQIKELKIQTIDIKSINDFYDSFENEIKNGKLGKAVLRFKF